MSLVSPKIQATAETDKVKPSFLIKNRGFVPSYYLNMHLFSAKDSVAGIAKARKNVGVFI